jgi:hypothetical protein
MTLSKRDVDFDSDKMTETDFAQEDVGLSTRWVEK